MAKMNYSRVYYENQSIRYRDQMNGDAIDRVYKPEKISKKEYSYSKRIVKKKEENELQSEASNAVGMPGEYYFMLSGNYRIIIDIKKNLKNGLFPKIQFKIDDSSILNSIEDFGCGVIKTEFKTYFLERTDAVVQNGFLNIEIKGITPITLSKSSQSKFKPIYKETIPEGTFILYKRISV